jgi:hypothetical protein
LNTEVRESENQSSSQEIHPAGCGDRDFYCFLSFPFLHTSFPLILFLKKEFGTSSFTIPFLFLTFYSLIQPFEGFLSRVVLPGLAGGAS